MKVIEETEKYILIVNSENSNVTAHDEQVLALGGKSYNLGEFCGEENADLAHRAICEVLSEWGLEVEQSEVIVIKDHNWSIQIDAEIDLRIKHLETIEENN